jgi:phytoene desaturase
MAKKVLVVGAGPGGLSAAMLLAHAGYEVDVYERKPYVGGRNSGFKLGDYTFDMGPTFFMMVDVLEEIFKRTGKKLADYADVREVAPMYGLYFRDKTFFPYRDEERMLKELETVFPGSSKGYKKYLRVEKKKYDKLIPCLRVPYGRFRDYMSAHFFKALPVLDAHRSLFRVLGRYFKHKDLKISFTFQAKYIGMSPWEAPGTFSIISYIEHGGGVYHVMGGLHQLAEGMARATRDLGGRIHTDCGVRRLLVRDGKAVGVQLDSGEDVLADYVVLNADFAHAMGELIDKSHRRKYTDKKLAGMKYSCSTFMLYLGVDGKVDLPHNSIFFARDYEQNVKEIVNTKILSEDFSFYVQNASLTDPTLAPAGKSAVYVLVPVPNTTARINWETEAPAFRERLLDALEQRAGIKDLRSRIECERMIVPTEWRDDVMVYNGATFNLGHNIGQMLYFRPHNEFEDVGNCYLVGGGTHPGSGLPTIYESGRISADMIIKRDAAGGT